VGNRAFGERITAIAKPEAARAIAAVYLLLPQVPMLFMGEEWAASQPFPFFCDFGGELADAVRRGRRKEFAKFPEFKDEKIRERIPDPQAEATFASAKLRWDETATKPHASWLEWYRNLLATRRAEIVPRLAGVGGNAARFIMGEEAVLVRWRLGGGKELTLAANLSATPREGFRPASGRILWQEGAVNGGRLGPWAVRWSIAQV
jgi:1,4-alpha-glucan branching enzyme